jgi:phage terminase large subunit
VAALSREEAAEYAKAILRTASPRAVAEYAAARSSHKAKTALTPESMLRYRTDPEAYVREVHRVDPTPDQCLILRSVVENQRTLAKAHNSSGKTWSAGMLANFWYDCWPHHIVYITAPSWDQAKNLTFKTAVLQRQTAGLPGIVQKTGRVLDSDPVAAYSHYIKAHNAESEEGFKGEHTAPILVIIEEAVGVEAYIWKAAEALLTNDASRLFVIGNPTDENTPFGRAAASPDWTVITMSALDHPNIEWQLRTGLPLSEGGPVPNAVSLRWVLHNLKEHCTQITDRESPIEDEFQWVHIEELEVAAEGVGAPASVERRMVYKPDADFQGAVLGEFPSQSDRQLIPRAWLTFINNRGPLPIPRDERLLPEVGVDTARFGPDRSVIIARRGPCILECVVLRGVDGIFLADQIRQVLHKVAERHGCSPWDIPVKIDVTGTMGTTPAEILKAGDYRVIEMNVSRTAFDPLLFHNRRSELWWHMRERIQAQELDLSRITDRTVRDTLVKELCAPQYTVTPLGKKVMEDKESMRKRLDGQSPDLADALNLAFSGYDLVAHDTRQRIRATLTSTFEKPRKGGKYGPQKRWYPGQNGKWRS